MSEKHIFTGFGFGPIQSGLFVKEAFASGNFDRIVVAEIDQKLVDAVRAAEGTYYVNVAHSDRVAVDKIENIEIYNPAVEEDRKVLLKALAESTEIVTSLPSVNFYDAGENSVAALITEGIKNSTAHAKIIYTAENNNHAAEELEKAVEKRLGSKAPDNVRFLNTVIGKMSQVVNDAEEIKKLDIKPMTPRFDRAFLVEAFNRIMVTRAGIDGFTPGIEVFLEKEDLLPFEEAKLYGHNAVHALLAYMGGVCGHKKMNEIRQDKPLMEIAEKAFIEESGKALIQKHGHLGDELFTESGYREYAEDLLDRMTNPYLTDTVERLGRDPVRKLGINDRIFGTMSIALDYGIKPVNLAMGGLAGIKFLLDKADKNDLPQDLRFGSWKELDAEQVGLILEWIWQGKDSKHSPTMAELVYNSKDRLIELAERK